MPCVWGQPAIRGGIGTSKQGRLSKWIYLRRLRKGSGVMSMQEVMDKELEQAIALLNEANKLMESLFGIKEEEE